MSEPDTTQELKWVVGQLNRTMERHGETLRSIDQRLASLVVVEERHATLNERFNEFREEIISECRSVKKDVAALKADRDRNYWITAFISHWLPLIIGAGIVALIAVAVLPIIEGLL